MNTFDYCASRVFSKLVHSFLVFSQLVSVLWLIDELYDLKKKYLVRHRRTNLSCFFVTPLPKTLGVFSPLKTKSHASVSLNVW
jgi:hypothetical protein